MRADRHLEAPIACGCEADKVSAVHTYLREHFPDYIRRDFHAPTRLMQDGLPRPHADHHVVGLEHQDVLPHYVILRNEFWEHALDDIEARLPQWNLAATLGAYRIIIVSHDGASAL